MESYESALIIARPGQLRDSLQVLLAAIPQIELVSQADDCRTALGIGREHCPALVLLDFDPLNNGIPTTLQQLKARWPRARSIVLVGDEQAQQIAQAAGADVVLTKGVLAARLFAAIEELLSR